MASSKFKQAIPWTQALTREAARPVFPRLPSNVRPYLLSATLFAAVSALMYLGDSALIRYGFSWAMVSLLMIVAAANLWGTRSAVLMLALSALYGALVVPHLPSAVSPHPSLPWRVLLVRTLVFVACGAATIWLTDRAQKMQRRAETGHAVVGALKSMMLPSTLADAPGYDLSGAYKPYHREEQVGGDFYDFYPIAPGRYGLLIGDVMGKGKEAAASIALLRYSVRAFTSAGMNPAHVMRQLNSLIEAQGLQFPTASLFFGVLDTRSHALSYANAGHEPPLLRRAGGMEEILYSTGPVLGIGLDAPYEEEVTVLGPGDALLLITDGVTEARNEQGRFLEGEGAWRLLRDALRSTSAHEALASLETALTAYIGDNHSDDIALLLLRRMADIPPASRSAGSEAGQIASGRSPREHACASFVP